MGSWATWWFSPSGCESAASRDGLRLGIYDPDSGIGRSERTHLGRGAQAKRPWLRETQRVRNHNRTWARTALRALAVCVVVVLGLYAVFLLSLSLSPLTNATLVLIVLNLAMMSRQPTVSAAPGWVRGCFIRWGPPRPQDSEYSGLRLADAAAFARTRGEQLVFIGAGGECVGIGSQVLYGGAVAVTLDRGSLHQGIPPDATVVFADSNPAASFDGWKLQ